MAITDTKKIDLLWKKVAFGKMKTDTNDNKKAPNESIVSEFIVKPSQLWSEAGSVPSTIPASNSGVLIIYTGHETTEDATSTARRTWKAGISNWVPPTFGSTYQLKVYVDSAGSGDPTSNGTQLFETGSGSSDEWFFDYQSGTLHFIGSSLPSGVTSGKSIFISGAKYNGNTGYTSANLVSATITSLTAPLSTAYGGTGLSSFTANALMGTANTSTIDFKTGSNGQIMIVTDNDVDFGDLDGGTY
tara:strand:+ start:169 stop:903 length:735 start_codon:yes stop_codon:yes gene_type:complete